MEGYRATDFGLLHASGPRRLLIADQRYPAGRAFGESAKGLGYRVLPTHGDVTDIWMRHLRGMWHTGDGEIAGMTGHDVLFCLERFAWDYRHCVVAWIDHIPGDQNDFDHVARTGNCEGLAATLTATGSNFPQLQGAVLGGLALASDRSLPSNAAAGARARELLASWVIAPRARSAQGVPA